MLVVVAQIVVVALFWGFLALFVAGKMPFTRFLGQAKFYDAIGYPLPYMVRGIWMSLFSFGFLMALVVVPSVYERVTGNDVSWPDWLLSFVVVGLLLFAAVLMPLFLVVSRTGKPQWLVPPEVRGLSTAAIWELAGRAFGSRVSER